MTKTFKQLKAKQPDQAALIHLELTLGLLKTYPEDMRFSLILSDLGSVIRKACKSSLLQDRRQVLLGTLSGSRNNQKREKKAWSNTEKEASWN